MIRLIPFLGFWMFFLPGCTSTGPVTGDLNPVPSSNVAQVKSKDMSRESYEQVAQSNLGLASNEMSARPLFSETPSYNFSNDRSYQAAKSATNREGLSIEESSLNIRNMPLAAFINEIFGDILDLNFETSAEISLREDLVTLRAENVDGNQLFKLAETVLSNYGVGIRADEKTNLYRFVIQDDSEMIEPPLLVTGEALPSVPESHRTIFQFVQLNAVAENQITNWLKTVFSETGLIFFGDTLNNAVVVKGPSRAVKQATDAIRQLDRPNMRGRHSLRISPLHLDASTLASSLSQVLYSEGINASLKPPLGSVILLPLKTSNAVIVFSADLSLIDHIKDWVKELDVPPTNSGGSNFFYYSVKNTSASDLAKALGVRDSATRSKSNDSTERQIDGANRIFVDENRNGLVFTGSRDEWTGFLPLIEAMDKPPRLVNVELTVASVTLSDNMDLGTSWLFTNSMGRFDGTGSTDFASGGSGFSYNLDNAGQVRFALNLLAQDQRVAILSKPSILVKSGETASIDVGEEIPIITSQGQSTESIGAPVLQSIEYRKTGVILEVSPVVHSGNRVDLAVSQEVSEVVTGQGAALSTPSIFNRSLTTSLTLRDGGAVILGGLISGSSSEGKSKIPLLGDVPLFGSLFRKSGNQESRSELIILIQAFIMDLDEELAEFNREVRDKFQLLDYDVLEIGKGEAEQVELD